MELRQRLEEGIVVLSLAGEFDGAEAEKFGVTIDGVIAGGASRLLLDLEDLTFIDSSAIQHVLEAEGKLLGAGGGLAIVKPKPLVQKIFRLLELGRRIPIVDDRAEARARLSEGSGE